LMLHEFRNAHPDSPLLKLIATVKESGYLVIDETLVVEVHRPKKQQIVLRVVLAESTGPDDPDHLFEQVLRWNFAQADQAVETIYLDAHTQKLFAEWSLGDGQLWQRSTEWRLERFLNRCEMLSSLVSARQTGSRTPKPI